MPIRYANSIFNFIYRFVIFTVILTIAACASLPERNPVPPELTTKVGIPGIPEARFWGDEWPKCSRKGWKKYKDSDLQ